MTVLKYNIARKNKMIAVNQICGILKQLQRDEARALRDFLRECSGKFEKCKKT
jgi:hypothetical protein